MRSDWSHPAGVLCCLQPKAVGVQRRERLRNSRTSDLSTRPSSERTGFKPASPEAPRLTGAKRESRATLDLSGRGAGLPSRHQATSSQTVQKSHSPGSARNSHPARAGRGTLSVWDFWSRAWTPVQSPETGATVWAKVTAMSGDSPLGPKKATCVVSGALTKSAWHKAGAPSGFVELMSCHLGDAAQGASHRPVEQNFLQSHSCSAVRAAHYGGRQLPSP